MGQVPLDVWREILLGLPSKSVIRFRAVCKSWLAIVDDPCFVRAHTNKQQQLSSNTTILIRNSTGPPLYSLDLETLNPTRGCHEISATPLDDFSTRRGLHKVAACNGLMLVSPKSKGPEASKTWEIWNPLTHERLQLPNRKFNQQIEATGLGYDSASDDYKVVVVDCESDYFSKKTKPTVLETHVYSLKSDSWRKIIDYPCVEGAYGSSGVFLSGALHWISDDDHDHDHGKLIALDLGTESYRELKMPPCRVLNDKDYNEILLQCQELGVLSGCLVVSDAAEEIFVDLWVRKDYGADDSWSKVFKISGRDTLHNYLGLRPVAYMKNKTQVFVQQEKSGFYYLFDLESGSVTKMVSIHGLTGHLSAQAYNGTIFRLHDNCGGGGGGTRKRRKTSQSKTKMADTKLTYRVRDLSWSTSQFHYVFE